MPDILLTHGFFPRGGREGAADHEAVSAARPALPVGVPEARGLSVEVFDSTFGELAALARRFADAPGGVLGIYTNLMTRGTSCASSAPPSASLDGDPRRARER
jgi:hypothetical protein